MYGLPDEFVARMKNRLPENEREAFFAVYETNRAPYKGIRVNTLKITPTEFEKISPFAIRPVVWEKNGYYTDGEKVGGHPYHFAGLFYSQEPSAMSVAPLLCVKPNEKVLDLCSAPGGKSTALASAMQGKGLLVCNEPIFSRAKILSSNIERMGITNAIVTCEYPEKLSAVLENYFDKILVDAPCSGEGMLRKNADEELLSWSEENVRLCAERQAQILENALKMLKVGGRLVYSTCTFAEEEDEYQTRALIKKHPELTLLEEKKLYPHKIEGEGHYYAVFEKTAGDFSDGKPVRTSVDKTSEKLYKEFEKEVLNVSFGNLYSVGETLYSLPNGAFDFTPFQVLRAGVRLGETEKGRFEPSHSLAMCLKRTEAKSVLDLSLTDERTEKFLHGETVTGEIKNGWCLVCVDGYPIGWGKAVNGTVKNHIPKSLRKMN